MDAGTDGSGSRRSLWKTPTLIAALILAIPALGNRFVDGWHWQLRAFVVVGTLVFGVALAYQLATRNRETFAYRLALGIALVAALLLVWVNFVQAADGANPYGLIHLAVPVIAILGAVIARLRPTGMTRALFATALAQALVLATVLVVRNFELAPWDAAVLRGFGANAVFFASFVGSALLFRQAARTQAIG